MSRRRLLKILLIFVPLGALIVVAAVVAQLANSPSEGVIKAAKPVAVSKQKAESFTTVHGKTVSFQYPDTLHQTKANALSSGDVEKFSFVNPTVSPWDLDIQIRQLPSGQLADDGSYNLRLRHPEQYSAQKLTINGAPVSIMSDQTAGFGKVAFLTHNGLVAEVALTSTDTGETNQLQATLMKVVQTWHWL